MESDDDADGVELVRELGAVRRIDREDAGADSAEETENPREVLSL